MIQDLFDLLICDLQALYNAENHILPALGLMADSSQTDELSAIFKLQMKESEKKIKRLEEIAEIMHAEVVGNPCPPVIALVEEASSMMQKGMPDVLNIAFIGFARKIACIKICEYDAAARIALMIEKDTAAALLQEALQDEITCENLFRSLLPGENRTYASIL